MQHPLLNIAVTAARKAGDIIIRALDRLENIKVSLKSSHDFVTEIDYLCEKTIIDIIQKAYPSHSILAEESGHSVKSTISQDNDYLWIIDPLDGTTNFIHGLPHFAVSIAIQYKNKLEHGVIYDPVKQELFTASRGKGAKLNQYRIRVSQCAELQSALLATGFHYKELPSIDHYHKVFSEFTKAGAGIRRTGSAALDLAYVAAGRLDGMWENGLGKWDIAAGSLLITEAGGLAAEPDSHKNFLDTGNIICANPRLFEQMLNIINH